MEGKKKDEEEEAKECSAKERVDRGRGVQRRGAGGDHAAVRSLASSSSSLLFCSFSHFQFYFAASRPPARSRKDPPRRSEWGLAFIFPHFSRLFSFF
jgi:hypothetical protein